MAYLLDTNVLIEAKDRYYQFSFCPGFWDCIKTLHDAGRVFSVNKVGDELAQREDELSAWAKSMGGHFFLSPDVEVLQALAKVAQWLHSQNYDETAIRAFLEKADYYLVSHALAYGHTVVTQEVPADTVRKIKIPNVCIGVGVPVINTFEMLKHEHARFILARER